jgi:hypothetical protein
LPGQNISFSRESELPLGESRTGDLCISAQSVISPAALRVAEVYGRPRLLKNGVLETLNASARKLQLEAFRNRKVPEDAGVEVGCARPAQVVAS